MGDLSYIAALDVGTTTIRCQIINTLAKTVAHVNTKVNLLYPQSGFVEINPDELWYTVTQIIKDAISKANLKPKDIKCLAISTQRASFITWKKDTGDALHNFITWKDMRSKELVKHWNNSLMFKSFRSGAYLLYLLTRNERYLMASKLNLTTNQCTGRLLWVLQNVSDVKEAAKNKNLCFATIDTWLVYKLTGGKKYISEVTHASSTGLYDPFILAWSDWPKQLIGIPNDIYPEVVNSDYDFGNTLPEIFGASIPIRSVMADQQASMFGSCCFGENDMKVTLGTGSFIDMHTGSKACANLDGIYPLVGWKFKNELVYLAEASCNDSGSLIQWALNVGIAADPSETSIQAYSVDNTDGVFFIPAFSGLGPPISDDQAASGFFGVKPTSKKEHLLRAILESIVYRIILAHDILKDEARNACTELCVDGGVSNNDFVCQMLADMSGLKVIRYSSHEKTILGVAFVAGLNAGVWKTREDLLNFKIVERIFKPDSNKVLRRQLFKNLDDWLSVVKRFKAWY